MNVSAKIKDGRIHIMLTRGIPGKILRNDLTIQRRFDKYLQGKDWKRHKDVHVNIKNRWIYITLQAFLFSVYTFVTL